MWGARRDLRRESLEMGSLVELPDMSPTSAYASIRQHTPGCARRDSSVPIRDPPSSGLPISDPPPSSGLPISDPPPSSGLHMSARPVVAYADTGTVTSELLQVCWRMLTYADVCWRMLTYADVCYADTGTVTSDPLSSRATKELEQEHVSTYVRIYSSRSMQVRMYVYGRRSIRQRMCQHTERLSKYVCTYMGGEYIRTYVC